MLLFCCTVGCFFSFPAVAGIIKHIKYRAGEAQIILTAEGKSRGKNIVPVLRFPFSPKSSSRSLSFFSQPCKRKSAGLGQFQLSSHLHPDQQKTKPGAFLFPFKGTFRRDARPTSHRIPAAALLRYLFFFFPLPSLT